MASRTRKLWRNLRAAASVAAVARLATAGALATVVASAIAALPPLQQPLGSRGRTTSFVGSFTLLQEAARAPLVHAGRVAPGHRRMRVLLQAHAPPELNTKLTVGEKLQGHVNRCGDSGAYIDLPQGQQGFLHISRMSDDYAAMSQRMLLVGREITIWVQDVRSTGKVMLTCRDPERMPKFERGQQLRGEVMGFNDYGAFVDVGGFKDGFVPMSKMTYDVVERANEVFQVGQKVTVWVDKIRRDRKLSLTCLRPVDLSGFVGISEKIWLPGTVEAVNWFSVHVLVEPPSIGPPQLGLVSKEELSDSGDVQPRRVASVGDYVRVRVTKVDPVEGLMLLSMRA